MSTILKALRRLEEDSSIEASNSSAPSSSSAALPATDPHATDELRSRILAEELAADASGVDVADSSNTKKRVLIATAIAAAAIVTTLIVGFGLGFYPPTPDDQADAAVAVSPSPSPFVPSPSPLRARSTSTTSIPSPFTPTPASPSPVLPVPVALPTEQVPPAAGPMEDQTTADTSVRFAAVPVVQSDTDLASQSAPATPTTSKSAKAASSSQSPTRQTDEPAAPAPRQEMPLAAVVPTAASLESGSVAATSASPRSGRSEPSAAIAATQSMRRPTPTRAERRATNAEAAVSAAKPPSEPTAEPLPKDRATKNVKPEAAAVEEHKGRAIPDITVLRTAWHPSPDRRSAKIRLLDTKKTMTLKEGDAIGGLVIQEISPSAVLFRSGEIEIRLRVGQPGSGS
jgi:hypothetical protein